MVNCCSCFHADSFTRTSKCHSFTFAASMKHHISLSLSHTHTHTHTHSFISLSLSLSLIDLSISAIVKQEHNVILHVLCLLFMFVDQCSVQSRRLPCRQVDVLAAPVILTVVLLLQSRWCASIRSRVTDIQSTSASPPCMPHVYLCI